MNTYRVRIERVTTSELVLDVESESPNDAAGAVIEMECRGEVEDGWWGVISRVDSLSSVEVCSPPG